MAKIPLNFFVRTSFESVPSSVVGTVSSVYEAPFQRASVIISALATNTDPINTRSMYAGLSTRGTPISQASPGITTFLSNFPVAPNDTVNIVVNKLVLSEYDNLFVWAADDSQSFNLTLSILETVNTQ